MLFSTSSKNKESKILKLFKPKILRIIETYEFS